VRASPLPASEPKTASALQVLAKEVNGRADGFGLRLRLDKNDVPPVLKCFASTAPPRSFIAVS